MSVLITRLTFSASDLQPFCKRKFCYEVSCLLALHQSSKGRCIACLLVSCRRFSREPLAYPMLSERHGCLLDFG